MPLNNIDLTTLVEALNYHKGMIISSGIDYPGRYNRWEAGFVNPPVEIIAYHGEVIVQALNKRGCVILALLKPVMIDHDKVWLKEESDHFVVFGIDYMDEVFIEEKRSLQPSVMTPIRNIIYEFSAIDDQMLGLYGAFGYELIYEFESCQLKNNRKQVDKLFHLFFADCVYVVDKQKETAYQLHLELKQDQLDTRHQSATPFETVSHATDVPFQRVSDITFEQSNDTFAQLVEKARSEMRAGNVFEVVFSRKFQAKVKGKPDSLYRTMKALNPSPYEFFCQFGDEQLVGTSPEMFVRVEGRRIESCPISGTIKRGNNAMEDEKRIRQLLNSYKDEVELTMCTDVDRNDKSRICEPGSVQLLARRTIERYIGLFHTVDHVEGKLRNGFTGVDGFLSHMWAVTLTGAPKKKAVQLIENHESAPRKWYGGSVGLLSFNGNVNSTITIRALHIQNDHAYYQAGATLVWDSEGYAEADETLMKAMPFYRALGQVPANQSNSKYWLDQKVGVGLKAVMIDYEDSFVHTLASYFRYFGVEIETHRWGLSADEIQNIQPHFVIHSPGPGRPEDFQMPELIQKLNAADIPQLGVCLGLQGIVEAFGGELKLLDDPRHGKDWIIHHNSDGIFDRIENDCTVAAYHSLLVDENNIPESELRVQATNDNGQIMAVEHNRKLIMGVQFHPESILSMHHDVGWRMIENVCRMVMHHYQ